MGTAGDRYRYQSRGGSAESALARERDRYGTSTRDTGASSSRASKYALGPSDSVSVVGASRVDPTSSSRKDPLEVIRRMEQSRAEHQKQWEVERSASVIGETSNLPAYSRPSSRLFDSTPRHARPATSMASMRDAYGQAAPRTAPIEDWRSRRNQAFAATDSPLVGRGGSRLNHQQHVKPATEPRPLRSSTSISSRLDIGLDVTTPSTEHGRLLFEACRALEPKLGPDIIDVMPDLIRTFQGSARSAENVNATIRDAVKRADDACVHLDLDEVDRARNELDKLLGLLRDAGRTSDQNIRELTRVLLDLPKLLRQADRAGPSRAAHRTTMEFNRRSSPIDHHPARAASRYDGSPARASQDMMRPSTSMGMVVGESTSPLHRYSLDSRRSVLQPRTQQPRDRDRNSAVSNLVAKMRGLTPRNSPLPQKHSDLQPIEQSPPNPMSGRISPSKSNSRSSLALSTSPTKSYMSSAGPPPPPRSPERRNVLRKKVSGISNHTVRGTSSSSFMPSSSKVQTTTAISTINAADFDAELTPAKSIRSVNTASTRYSESEEIVGSPVSRYSFGPPGHDANIDIDIDQTETETESQVSGMRGSLESGGREDAISVLEHSLVAAARKREGEDRRPSMSERFRATLRRNGSTRVKD